MAAKEQTEHSLDLHKDEHPVGTGIGAAGGAVAGAAIGAAGGPAGALVGGVIGAVAGGLAGRGLAHVVNHDQEDAYWREAHTREPYYNPERSYEDYAPAYRLGWESRAKYDDGTYDHYEPAFGNDWDRVKGTSRLTWEEAKHATRAAWHRMERALPGDADGDHR
jgi:phage tail tape-measure protein